MQKATHKEHNLLQTLQEKFQSIENLRTLAIDSNRELLSFLLENAEFRERFFTRIDSVAVFEKDKFLDFLKLRMLNKSYTAFSNKIGLQLESSFENTSKVVLNFPFKDCVLKGAQSKDEQKSKEIFFNEVLARSEIDILFSPKALQNFELIGQGDLKENLNNANLLIKGNNLLALHSLKKKFANKVKLIYIDPPYNTGNDSFNYNDNFNHSTWLCFMKNRLEIAREFLRDDGVIFIQCDDNEQAYLKVLMDEIFGRENFVGCIVWLKGNAQNDADTMQRNQEYILCYAKNIESKPLYKIKQKVNVKAFKDEKTGRFYYEGAGLTTGGAGGTLNARPNLGFSIYYNPQTKDFFAKDDYDRELAKISNDENEVYTSDSTFLEGGYEIIRPPKKGVGLGRWTWALDKFNTSKNDILIRRNNNGYIVVKKEWLDSKQVKQDENGNYYAIIEKENPPKSFADFVGSGVGSKENKALFDTKVFNNPKPEALMKYIIEISTRAVAEGFCDDFVGCQGGGEGSLLNINDRADNADSRKSTQKPTPDLVMDFFAGSGTTLAVAMKMNRRWIGIEQMDYIESITKERLKKVVAGEQGGISKAVDWQGGGSFIYCKLMPLNVMYKEKIQNLACHTAPCHTKPCEVSKNVESTKDLHKDISLSLNMTSIEKELEKIYNDLESKAFVDYRVDIQAMLKDKEFYALSLDEKRKVLYAILDSNMDYVLYDDIDDSEYGVSDELRELNKIFYGENDE
ncbi:DNA methyltransferase [Helicobacter cinaedi]|uniref:DNA methyltransferase n=1 Tax=Helicobacter cinaedi TaxID=213 RepID=UPI000D7BB5B9|nr:site-specific DNA-methyltransferase [Helicobacter cinaedi]BBB20967.1 type III restriction-modification system methylation subunit [Helicobacter cinaedi]